MTINELNNRIDMFIYNVVYTLYAEALLPPETTRAPYASMGNGGVRGISELVKQMNTKKPRFMAPILLESYEDFKKFAGKAAVVTYSTEYFDSPFLDDSKRLRRLILHAVGVEMNDFPLTFKYIFEYGDLLSGSTGWDEQTSEADRRMRSILEHLRAEYNLIEGTVETPHHSWKRLAVAKS